MGGGIIREIVPHRNPSKAAATVAGIVDRRRLTSRRIDGYLAASVTYRT